MPLRPTVPSGLPLPSMLLQPQSPPVPRQPALALRTITLLISLTLAGRAGAHGLQAAGDAPGWGAEPWVLACLLLSVLLYAAGWLRLKSRSRRGQPLRRAQAAWFAVGSLSLAVALASPLDGAGGVSFAAHMVQHEVLMIVAAPLLVQGRPLGVWAWGLPRGLVRRLGAGLRSRPWQLAWRQLTRPLHAWLLHFAALWLWHVPALFQAALLHPAVHAMQHASFLFSALLFWWAVLDNHHGRGAALAFLFTTMLHTGALGALFAVSGQVWYPAYGGSAAQYGLSALEDQQLGGLIMWVPGGLAYVIAGLMLCADWLAPRARGAAP
ncbi:cytochrome c oxidase assembly protein [Oxalobacteraceae bacterium A2-2]